MSLSTDSSSSEQWQTICHKDDLVKHSGVCALLKNDQQIAIFKINDDEIYSISNWDPAGNANVLYRGIIGDSNGEIFVAFRLHIKSKSRRIKVTEILLKYEYKAGRLISY